MDNEIIPHTVLPKDIEDLIFVNLKAKGTWDSITPLAKNEWICFLTCAKTDKGTMQRITRAKDQLSRGQKRPCCWPGCPHRLKKYSK